LYKDVRTDTWYSPFVADVVEDDIARGYKDKNGNLVGEFGIDKPITHAEILKMALEAAGISDTKASPPRNQSARNDWSSSFVGIAEAKSFTVFKPTLDVHKAATRAEVVQTILDAFGIATGSSPSTFSDVPKNHPYTNAIAIAAFYGIVKGDTDAAGNPKNTFRPDQNINRAEAAKLITLARALKGTSADMNPLQEVSVRFTVSNEASSASAFSVKAEASASSSAMVKAGQAKVINAFVNVRADSRVDSALLFKMYKGAIIDALWTLPNGWTRIKTADNKEGYVMTQFLELLK
jgi:hypothetical protein